MSNVRLPLDLTQITPFRKLKAECQGAIGTAQVLFWELWRELGYLAQDGNDLGVLPCEAVAGFKLALHEQGIDPEAGFQALLKSELLLPHGDDYTCPRFSILNADFKMAKREQIGGNMKKFNGAQKKMDASLLKQAMLISESKFVDAQGVALGADEVRRVTRLIISCDNALFKPERPSPGFTEGLIQSALIVARKYTDDEIQHTLYSVAYKRKHPALEGMTTERLLPQFGELAVKLIRS